MGLPQLLILPDADPVARRIMLEEHRQELIQDSRPGGIRVKKPEMWKIWEEGIQHGFENMVEERPPCQQERKR